MERNAKPTLFIQFAGQGVKYIDELRRLYESQPEMQDFIQEAIATVKREAANYDDSETRFFSRGLDADLWLARPDKTPDAGYLSTSPLSHPYIFLSQISNFITVLKDGIDPSELVSHTHSVTGFSTGIVAAILVSLNLSVDRLSEMALKAQAMFFWQGVRCQQSMYRFGLQPKLEPENINSIAHSPTCMVSVNNLPLEGPEELIKQYAPYGVVHPAYELLPGRWILAGLPENLSGFQHFLSSQGMETEWKYIPSTIAAHCPFLDYALETSPLDANKAGLIIKGSDLQLPVWANDMGKDLRESDDVIFDVMKAYFTKPASWRKQIAPLLEDDQLAYVLDFGPGAGVASLTENYLKGRKSTVIRCTVPLGRKRLFKEVLPSLN